MKKVTNRTQGKVESFVELLSDFLSAREDYKWWSDRDNSWAEVRDAEIVMEKAAKKLEKKVKNPNKGV